MIIHVVIIGIIMIPVRAVLSYNRVEERLLVGCPVNFCCLLPSIYALKECVVTIAVNHVTPVALLIAAGSLSRVISSITSSVSQRCRHPVMGYV